MWKKIVVVVALFVAISFVQYLSAITAIDKPTIGSELTTPYGRWLTVGPFSSTGVEPIDLIDAERTYLIVQALIIAAADGEEKIIIKQLKYGVNSLRFRLAGLTDNDKVVLQLYGGSLGNGRNCEFVKKGTLTFTIGAQVSTSPLFEMADTLIITNTDSVTMDWTVASPANNTCAEGSIDWQGEDIICVVPTIIPSDCQLFMKDY